MTGIAPSPTDADWQHQLDRLFERLLAAGGDRYFSNTALEADLQAISKTETAPTNDPISKINWQFLQARVDYEWGDRQTALARLQSCLEFWQTGAGTERWGRIAIIYEHLGWCYREAADWERARHAFSKCLLACERAGRTDAALRRAGALANVLQHLQAWDALQQLTERALHWLGLQPSPLPATTARIFSWQTAAALQQERWREAVQTARSALEALSADTSAPDRTAAGLYHLQLAQAHLHLGEPGLARENWTQAIALEPEPQEREAYCQEFQNLIVSCQACGDPLTAFHLKKALHRYERQVGLRAFVGAMSLPTADAARVPGREGDLEALLQHLLLPCEPNKPLLLYGPHQSGKRSLLDAGLVPTLERQGWRILRVRDCQRWTAELGSALTGQRDRHLIETPQVLWERLQALQASEQQLTVMIFDRLEALKDWPPLCAFLGRCLQDPNLRVVLSLREAALHRALDALQAVGLADLEGLHHLDYLSADRAMAALQALGAAPSASERLVRDLRNDRDVVLPLRLQLAGLQLEEDGFTPQPAAALLERYLGTVVRDCGSDNVDAAWLTFFALTDPGGRSRVRKTEAELARALERHQTGASKNLEVILDIAVAAGVLWQRSELPVLRYELTSPAFVTPGRREGQRICAKITQAKRAQRQNRQQARDLTVIGTSILTTLAVSLVGVWGWQQIIKTRDRPLYDARVRALSAYSRDLARSERPFPALVAALRAARPLQTGQLHPRTLTEPTRLQLAVALHDSLYAARERNQLDGHAGAINAVAVHDNVIVSAGADGSLQLWNADGSLRRTLIAAVERAEVTDDLALLAVAISPDGQSIVAAGADGSLQFWDGDGRSRARTASDSAIHGLAIAPDSQAIAAGTAAGNLELYDANGRLDRRIQAHQAPISDIAFSPDGRWVATASRDKTVKIFNRQGNWQATLRGHRGWVNAVTFGIDSEILATASGDGSIGFWSREGDRLDTLAKPHKGVVTDIAFNPDGEVLASASSDGTIKLWDERGELLQSFASHTDAVSGIAFTSDGKTLASGSRDGSLKIWQPDGARPPSLAAHPREVTSLAFSADGKLMVSTSWDGTIKLWNRTGELLRTLEGHEGVVNRAIFAPNGRTLVSVGIDGSARFWNRRGEAIREIAAHSDWAVAAAFAPDGKVVATAGWDGKIALWNRDGERQQTFAIAPEPGTATKPEKPAATSVAFSPDGELLAAGSSDRRAYLWRRDGTLAHTLKGHRGPVYSVAFSPDGEILATASLDRTIKLWRASDGLELETLQGHHGGVFDATFSPDGQLLATASSDGTVKLWNRDGRELLTLTGDGAPVYAASFTPDSKVLAAANYDGTIALWDLGLESLLARSCTWLEDYRRTHPDPAIRRLCPGQ